MDVAEIVTIVQDQVGAYNARDIDSIVGYYSDDAVIVDGIGAAMAEGRQAIRALFERVFANNPELHAEVPTAFRVGDWVAIHSIVQNWNGSGQQMQWIELYQVVNGKIKRVQLFK